MWQQKSCPFCTLTELLTSGEFTEELPEYAVKLFLVCVCHLPFLPCPLLHSDENPGAGFVSEMLIVRPELIVFLASTFCNQRFRCSTLSRVIQSRGRGFWCRVRCRKTGKNEHLPKSYGNSEVSPAGELRLRNVFPRPQWDLDLFPTHGTTCKVWMTLGLWKTGWKSWAKGKSRSGDHVSDFRPLINLSPQLESWPQQMTVCFRPTSLGSWSL